MLMQPRGLRLSRTQISARQRAELVAVINIYKALGGGWRVAGHQPAEAE